jgi:hypothetical protein
VRSSAVACALAALAAAAGCGDGTRASETPRTLAPLRVGERGVQVWASGLENPRGLLTGRNGSMLVAEGGVGGLHFTGKLCKQVPPPLGPYRGGLTGRISVVTRTRVRRTLVARLPSTQGSEIVGGVVSGVADLARLQGRLYALVTGGGCSHGVPRFPNAVIEIRPGGRWRMVADLSRFMREHPGARPYAEDFEPDGNWYSLLAHDGSLYAVESNLGQVVRIEIGGRVSRVVDVSARQGHAVPTALLRHDGSFYLGKLGTYPIVPGSQSIDRLSSDGRLTPVWRGFTAVVDLAVRDGKLYVLETTTKPPDPPTPPYAGDIVAVDLASGRRHVVLRRLTAPTSMQFGPDGSLYVTNLGYLSGNRRGEILRIPPDIMRGR